MPTDQPSPAAKRPSLPQRLIARGMKVYAYVTSGVWSDTRQSWRVSLVKTLNLSVRSFFSGDLQMRAAALTYQTILALVPALALLFAIARGFGFQNLVQSQLFSSIPAQRQALDTALTFVDSYLAQSSEGIFVGVGIVFLLWTLISLLSSVEESFNRIWGSVPGRSMWRKITDYTAIFLILPVLMICASGITLFMSTTLQSVAHFKFLTPVIGRLLDAASLVLVWLFFAGTYMLIPNAKVKIKNALIAGVLAGTAFIVLQWLFVNGQVYVTRYNAIYGSFAFLPLLLIWLQLVWLITLSGGVLCYASQNITMYAYSNEADRVSASYRADIVLAVLTTATRRFVDGQPPLDDTETANTYGIPVQMVTAAATRLVDCGLLQRVLRRPGDEVTALSPARDPATLTLGDAIKALRDHGSAGFIPGFDKRFGRLLAVRGAAEEAMIRDASTTLVKDIDINKITINQSPTE